MAKVEEEAIQLMTKAKLEVTEGGTADDQTAQSTLVKADEGDEVKTPANEAPTSKKCPKKVTKRGNKKKKRSVSQLMRSKSAKRQERNNKLLSLIIQPKPIVKLLNEYLSSKVTYHEDQSKQEVGMRVVDVIYKGKVVATGKARKRSDAKVIAAEIALKNITKKRLKEISGETVKEIKASIIKNIPWKTLASFALYRMLRKWRNDGIDLISLNEKTFVNSGILSTSSKRRKRSRSSTSQNGEVVEVPVASAKKPKRSKRKVTSQNNKDGEVPAASAKIPKSLKTQMASREDGEVLTSVNSPKRPEKQALKKRDNKKGEVQTATASVKKPVSPKKQVTSQDIENGEVLTSVKSLKSPKKQALNAQDDKDNGVVSASLKSPKKQVTSQDNGEVLTSVKCLKSPKKQALNAQDDIDGGVLSASLKSPKKRSLTTQNGKNVEVPSIPAKRLRIPKSPRKGNDKDITSKPKCTEDTQIFDDKDVKLPANASSMHPISILNSMFKGIRAVELDRTSENVTVEYRIGEKGYAGTARNARMARYLAAASYFSQGHGIQCTFLQSKKYTDLPAKKSSEELKNKCLNSHS